jgi:hypothetical protein
MRGVLNIPLPEIGLQGAGIVAGVSQDKAAGVPQHMGIPAVYCIP